MRMTGYRHEWIRILFGAVLLSGVMGCNRPAPAAESKTDTPAATSAETLTPEPKKTTADADTLKTGVMVYYFHGTRRCRTCVGIQKTIANTVSTHFAKEVSDGRLIFREINIEEPANQHYAAQYQLSFGTLVVEALKDGDVLKWENCHKVWNLVRDNAAMTEYVRDRISNMHQLAEGK